MNQKIVIIGAGQAACSFAARLREHDPESELTIIGDETSHPYQRPPLSKKYVTGEMEAERLLLRPLNWYEDNNVKVICDQQAVSIDRDNKTITLSGGGSINWDKLLLATGSSPRALPASIGGALDGVYLLRSVADADAIRSELVEGRRAVIVGGGYIGLEAAASAAMMGLKVTVVEAAERILQRVACQETSGFFKNLHQTHGVDIHENSGLDRIEEKNGRACAVILTDGTRIETDFVLVGIGIIPNMAIAEAAGLEVEGGIKVNAHCQTSDPTIYAAGDCAVFEFNGLQTRLESVQNAIDQAECAADNVAGVARDYTPYPWFWSDQYDIKLQIAGLNRGYDRIVTRVGDREGSLTHWYFAGSNLLAVDAMNDSRSYMVGKKLLEAGRGLTPEQAADTSLVLKSLL